MRGKTERVWGPGLLPEGGGQHFPVVTDEAKGQGHGSETHLTCQESRAGPGPRPADSSPAACTEGEHAAPRLGLRPASTPTASLPTGPCLPVGTASLPSWEVFQCRNGRTDFPVEACGGLHFLFEDPVCWFVQEKHNRNVLRTKMVALSSLVQ